MKRKMAKVTIYSGDNMQIYDEMKVQVDDKGEEWLSPDQVDYLERFHNVAQLLSRYTAKDSLEHTEQLTISCSSQLGLESEEVSTKLTPRFYKSTPKVMAFAL